MPHATHTLRLALSLLSSLSLPAGCVGEQTSLPSPSPLPPGPPGPAGPADTGGPTVVVPDPDAGGMADIPDVAETSDVPTVPPPPPSPPAPACGDGVLDDAEECEPALPFPAACVDHDARYTGGQVTCGPDCRLSFTACAEAACGDGILDDAEECDDANQVDGDGCSARCLAELDPVLPPCGNDSFLQQAVRSHPTEPTCDDPALRGAHDDGQPLAVRASLHVVASEEGRRAASDASLREIVDLAQAYFDPGLVTLVPTNLDMPHVIRNDYYYRLHTRDLAQLSTLENDPHALDVYVVHTIETGDDGRQLRGFAASIGLGDGPDAVAVRARDAGPTLAHELGHLMGLWHTHQDYERDDDPELCHQLGDRCCDTPPDPGDPGVGCPNAEDCGDHCNDPDTEECDALVCTDGSDSPLDDVRPDVHNRMSYYECGRVAGSSHLSAEQLDRVRCHILLQLRHALVGEPQVDRVEPAAARLGEWTSFEVHGVGPFPPTLTVRLEDCEGLEVHAVHPDLATFACTPAGPPGDRVGAILDAPDGRVLHEFGVEYVDPDAPCTGPPSEDCGACGTRSRTCDRGLWTDWSACLGEGPCRPGEHRDCPDGGLGTCGPDCRWEPCGCPGPPEQACGNCGVQRRECLDGQWSPWGPCLDDPCVCREGQTRVCGPAEEGVCRPGLQVCRDGVFGPCEGHVTPSAEVCDGLDNDCNGDADDDLGTASCGTGECFRTVERCQDGRETPCEPGQAQPEVCDGRDNDCDGEADEDLPAVSCGVGACLRTVAACDLGEPARCQPGEPRPETCDGVDEDCDGVPDDGNPGGGVPCDTGRAGLCADGILHCQEGRLVCEPDLEPTEEICDDGLDNDCDGEADEEQDCGVCARQPDGTEIDAEEWSECLPAAGPCDPAGRRRRARVVCRDELPVEVEDEQACARQTEGLCLDEGPWSPCGSWDGTCSRSGERRRPVQVCRGGRPVAEEQVEACERPSRDGIVVSDGEWGACAGFQEPCGRVGEQEREVLECWDDVSVERTEHRACERSTEGEVVDVGEWSACEYPDECGEVGTRVRPRRVCEAGQVAERFDEEDCRRDTDAVELGATGWTECAGFAHECAVRGTRRRTVRFCRDGRAREEERSEPCTRASRDGVVLFRGLFSQCGGFQEPCGEQGRRTRQVRDCDGTRIRERVESVDCSRDTEGRLVDREDWGACTWPTQCSEEGSQQRTRRECRDGAVVAVPEQQACDRATEGQELSGTGWTACGSFSDLCDETGLERRQVTVCRGGQAVQESRQRQCLRDTDGVLVTRGGWGACQGFSSVCDESGVRYRVDTVCRGGQAVSETQEQVCGRDTDGQVVDPPGWGACAGFAGTCGESGEQTGIRTVCRDGRSRDEVVRRACRREREGVTCERWGTCRDEQCVDERDSYSADGCRGGAYDWSCNRHCERCRLQDGFLCYNQDGCGGLTCCLRYAGAGLDGMVVLYTRLRQTAYGRWLFDEPLAGTYRVIADVPSIQGLPVPNGCGRWNLARAVRHNLKVGDETVATTVRDHGVDTGRSVVLFEGDLTGVTGVTVGNAWDGAGGECGHILLDRIRAEPYL